MESNQTHPTMAGSQESATLRVAVIGLGNIGKAHAATIARGDVPGMILSALCDTDPAKREYLATQYPTIPLFDDYLALLDAKACDAVIIATPHLYHPIMARDALLRHIHVLSEKPAGVDCATLPDLYAVARESGCVFGIMFNQRTDPLFAKARELVKSGRLGQPKRLVWIITNWYRTQSYYDSGDWRATWQGEGGGVLLNQAPHNLDLWQWIFGMPARIRAFCYRGKYHDIAVEDEATIYAEYEGGATATFITTTGEYPGTNRLEISGDRGKLVLENGELHFYELSIPEREYCFQADKMPQPTCTETVIKQDQRISGHTLILRNFTGAILRGEPLLAPGTDGIWELTLSNAAYLSADTDDWVDVPLDTGDFTALLESLKAAEAIREKAMAKAAAKAEAAKAARAAAEAEANAGDCDRNRAESGNQDGGSASDVTYKDRWQVQW